MDRMGSRINYRVDLDPTRTRERDSSAAWRKLDSKFLSNDTPTKAQGMLKPVTPADRLDHILNHKSDYIRASDLELFINNVELFHLKQHFQLIVTAIFGVNNGYPQWKLISFSKSGGDHVREAEALFNLLRSTGPLVQLATRLLDDPGFLIEVNLDQLPFALSQRIRHGDVPSFFSSRMTVSPQMRRSIRVNTFEFFFISYAAHICELKAPGPNSNYLVGWDCMTDNIYHNLLDDYLAYFFPCDGHGVPRDNFRLSFQQMSDNMYVAQPSGPNLSPTGQEATGSPVSGERWTPRLIKSSLLQDLEQAQATLQGNASQRRRRSQREIWRSETILLIFTEMWMAHAPDLPVNNYFQSPASSDRSGKIMLPSVNVVRSARVLVRHTHFFMNCMEATVMHPMEDMMGGTYSTYQKRLYKFLRYLFYNWPLDNSFRIVYETWLCYVQPWRYTRIGGPRTGSDSEEPDYESRWYGFIQDNILFFTKLFKIMLMRMCRIDLATSRNAYMLSRVSRVIAGPETLKMVIEDIDVAIVTLGRSRKSYAMGDGQRGASILRITSLMQTFKEWEQPDYVYESLFSHSNKQIAFQVIENANKARNELQGMIDEVLSQAQQKQHVSWWKFGFGSDSAVGSPASRDLEKIVLNLNESVARLADFFNVPIFEPPPESIPSAASTYFPNATFIGSSLNDSSILDGTDNRVTVLPPGTFDQDMLIPVGNPDLAPPLNHECASVVKTANSLSSTLNDQMGEHITKIYFQRNWKGRVTRAMFAGPQEYFTVERRTRKKERVKRTLPPRVKLRFLGSSDFLKAFVLFHVVFVMLGVETWPYLVILLIYWLLFVLIRAATEPENKLDELVEAFCDQNGVFRGGNQRTERD